MLQGHRQTVDQGTRWRRVQADWRETHRDTLPSAFEYLREILSVEEYERMVKEYETGYREVRLENGFIVTSLTPAP